MAPELERVARGGSGASCCAALDTLALAAFVLAEDEGTTRGLMDRLRALWKQGGWVASGGQVGGELGSGRGQGAVPVPLPVEDGCKGARVP